MDDLCRKADERLLNRAESIAKEINDLRQGRHGRWTAAARA